ncbi:MAG: hypothetical protein ABSF60_06010 [Verrucomicrobiota bacterium]|jgi:hypothetical protein
MKAESKPEQIRCPVFADGVQISVPVPVCVNTKDPFLTASRIDSFSTRFENLLTKSKTLPDFGPAGLI